jgi:hypothetical protein
MAEDWTPVRIPLLRPPSRLPAPLLKEREFLQSTIVLREHVSHHRVVAVGEHFIVKHGRGVEEIEGQTLLFLERFRSKSLIVPRLYAMWRMSSIGHLCLVMERIHGLDLESAWPTLTDDDKSAICAKLKNSIDYLRSIPLPGYYGGVGSTKLPHDLFWDKKGDKDNCGPFQNSSDVHAALFKKLRMIFSGTGNADHITAKASFYERHLDIMLGSHPPMLSHSDLQRKNILFRKTVDSVEAAIIDWEAAGWYPSYWEYAIIFCSFQWNDDWPQYFEEFVEPWPMEATAMRMLYQDTWF